MKKRTLAGTIALASGLAFGHSAATQASAYAAAYNNITNLSVISTDAAGENGPVYIPLEAFTGFFTLTTATALLDGAADPAYPNNSRGGSGPVASRPAFGLDSIFPGGAPANNDTTVVGQGGNYSRADSQIISTAITQLTAGGPVLPTGQQSQAWGVAEVFVAADGYATANAREGSETGFNTQIVLNEPAIIHISFDADPYMEVELSSTVAGGSANANIDVLFTITSGTGLPVFRWSPDGEVGDIFMGVELRDDANINASVETTSPGTSSVFDPTGDSSTGVAVPPSVKSFAASTLVLPAGIYTLGLDMFENVNLSTSEETRASLGDRVWEDLNADGIQDCTDNGDGIIGGVGDIGDECDTGIPNVTVSLLVNPDMDGACNSGDEFVADTTFTNLNGFYEFTELDTSVEYCVRFDQPSANEQLDCNDIANPGIGAQFSAADRGGMDDVDSDANVTTGQTGSINLLPLQFDRTWDAGLYCPAKLGDTLIEDSNRNGIQDPGELGVENQTVELIRCLDGTRIDVIDTTVTGPDGMYMFNPLPPGEYAVRFSKPADSVFSDQDQGLDDAIDCDTDMNGVTACVTLAPGEYNNTVDACVNLPTAGLGDRVWEDLDADGVQDLGENGIENVIVNLLTPGADGNCNSGDEIAVESTVTAANGFYEFLELDPGRYCVAFEKPDICDPIIGGASAFSPSNVGADNADSDADQATGQTGNIDLSPGEYDPTNDGGVYCPAKIGDRVWLDSDEDGIQDDGEAGVSGVTVELYACGDDGLSGPGDELLQSTSTVDGMYMFNPLVPGNYFVRCIAPDGTVLSPQNSGGNDAIDSDADTATGIAACTNLQSNEYDPTWDCGLIEPPVTGGEGCTPGFWKQTQHFAAWLNPPYAPSTLFDDVFENAFPGQTLLQVLGQGGGGLNALGRHTVAALLNSATADVSYDVGTPAGVINAFNAVYPGSKSDYTTLKNSFAGSNEQGCPINGKSAPSNL